MSWLLTFGLLPSSPFPPPPEESDLLASVVQYLLATTSVTGLLGAPTNVFHEQGAHADIQPFIVIEGYTELLPGETTEDQPVPMRICCIGGDEAVVRQLGVAVKNAVDSLAINPNSIRTGQFVFDGGQTTGLMRNASRPHKMRGVGKGSQYVWAEEIDYEFWVTPNQ